LEVRRMVVVERVCEKRSLEAAHCTPGRCSRPSEVGATGLLLAPKRQKGASAARLAAEGRNPACSVPAQ
jgi:hypothetical protein